MNEPRDEFLSEEDLDLKNLSQEELETLWVEWLRWAQASNDLDEHDYSHGVFVLFSGRVPAAPGPPARP